MTTVGIVALALWLSAIAAAATQTPSDVVARSESCCQCQRFEFTTGGSKVITVPDFCTDCGCAIHIWQNVAPLGVFEYGLFPIYYWESENGEWIGWPDVHLGGIGFSGGSGTNGDRFGDAVFRGGSYEYYNGGELRILDDSEYEGNPEDQWTVVWELPQSGEYDDEYEEEYRLILILCPL